MRKKVFTLLLVLGLVAAQPLTAGATAPSGSTSVTVGGDDSTAYDVAPASEQFTGDRAPVAATLDKITQFNSSQINLSTLVDVDEKTEWHRLPTRLQHCSPRYPARRL